MQQASSWPDSAIQLLPLPPAMAPHRLPPCAECRCNIPRDLAGRLAKLAPAVRLSDVAASVQEVRQSSEQLHTWALVCQGRGASMVAAPHLQPHARLPFPAPQINSLASMLSLSSAKALDVLFVEQDRFGDAQEVGSSIPAGTTATSRNLPQQDGGCPFSPSAPACRCWCAATS